MLHVLKNNALLMKTRHPQDHGRLQMHIGIHSHCVCTSNTEKIEHMWDSLVCVQMHWF